MLEISCFVFTYFQILRGAFTRYPHRTQLRTPAWLVSPDWVADTHSAGSLLGSDSSRSLPEMSVVHCESMKCAICFTFPRTKHDSLLLKIWNHEYMVFVGNVEKTIEV